MLVHEISFIFPQANLLLNSNLSVLTWKLKKSLNGYFLILT